MHFKFTRVEIKWSTYLRNMNKTSELNQNQILRALELWAFNEVQELNSPMAWVTGPRQCGKTYLTHKLFQRHFNWDTEEVKKAFLKDPYFFRDLGTPDPVVVFDEIHKRKNWKASLKGYYDTKTRVENFVVTGSGRFDFYKKGSDSLQGRYFSNKLWPLTFDEVRYFHHQSSLKLQVPRNWKTFVPKQGQFSDQQLIEFGGFPAPYLKQSRQFSNRWCDQYVKRLINEDTRDFAQIQDLDKLELLARLLPSRITAPISEKSLSEDIKVAPVTIKKWMKLLETLYLGFSVPAFHKKIHRAVKKERKWYFYQWAFCETPGERFENYLAVQLGAVCSAWRDQGHGLFELCYLRDQDRREVDFVILKNKEPLCLIEAKSSPQSWPNSLHYYTKKLKIPGFLVYPEGPVLKEANGNGYSLPSQVLLKELVG